MRGAQWNLFCVIKSTLNVFSKILYEGFRVKRIKVGFINGAINLWWIVHHKAILIVWRVVIIKGLGIYFGFVHNVFISLRISLTHSTFYRVCCALLCLDPLHLSPLGFLSWRRTTLSSLNNPPISLLSS